MRKTSRVLLCCALALVTLPVAADAPDGSDPNRAAQYDAFVGSTTEIHDAFTHLTWQRATSSITRTLAGADTDCASSFSGRVPTVKELLTLVDEAPHFEYNDGKIVEKAIDKNAFSYEKTRIDAPYWTSTPTGDVDMVWAVDFTNGTMVKKNQTTDTIYVRCVR